MSRPLKILHVCSEVAPLVKTGGLGDVCASLPRALRGIGHDVRIAVPCYGTIPRKLRGRRLGTAIVRRGNETAQATLRKTALPGTDVPVYLVEHAGYFDRPHPYSQGSWEYGDNLQRFCFFCLAVLEGMPLTDWQPDVVHCHDWHTAMLPAYLKTLYADHPMWKGTPTVYTIHNLAYQGCHPAALYPETGLDWKYFTPEYLEFYGSVNMMKAGIAFADRVNTVSPQYAKEIQTPEFGHGMDGFLRTRGNHLSGILNGIDYETWNPATDPLLARSYSRDDISGKQHCKAVLQERMRFPVRDVPLFGVVSRLVWDKGIDLIVTAMESMLNQDIQLVVLGKGDRYYELALFSATLQHPGKIQVILDYDEQLAHRIYAGADFQLMPSHSEPCGLSQLYSLAYGTIPIVRKTGGLADTVVNLSRTPSRNGPGTGIVFNTGSTKAIVNSLTKALKLYRDPDATDAVRRAGMAQDYSWRRSSQAYVDLYREAMAKS
jgi:starch synthase